MKYCTPQRYVDFNSDDDEVADRADQQWERALADYRNHLKRISGQLNEKVREFAKASSLHDAPYLGLTKISLPSAAGDLAILAVERAEQVVLLVYMLADEPLVERPLEAAVFSNQAVHWLYDEIDISPNGTFSHRILLSDGRIVSLRFVDFDEIVLPKSVVQREGQAAATAAL
ncbi:MAG TPA: hypothetical protein VGX76_24865 [Pirellulales bacterium]|nr:hypothetical protein [Pirellulales bacterium]